MLKLLEALLEAFFKAPNGQYKNWALMTHAI